MKNFDKKPHLPTPLGDAGHCGSRCKQIAAALVSTVKSQGHVIPAKAGIHHAYLRGNHVY